LQHKGTSSALEAPCDALYKSTTVITTTTPNAYVGQRVRD